VSSPRILVVDDEVNMLRSVERVLKSRYEVSIAATRAEALGALREHEPQLAILDIRMPEADGFSLMGELRLERPDLDVIFMTGAVHEIDSQLIRAIREKAFYFIQKPFDREVLLTIVERCLELRRLAEENKRYVAELEAELEAAVHFQRSLLPPAEGASGPLHFAGSYRPCAELGGDLYDWVGLGNGRLAFVLADVSGHGAAAAMLTSIVKSAFHAAEADGFAPASVVRHAAAAMAPFPVDKFVSLFCGLARADEGRLEYVNAGHPAPLLRAPDGQIRELTLTGPILSPVMVDVERVEESVRFAAGDSLFAYTDGLVEAKGTEGLFGEERLRELIGGAEARGARLLREVESELERFCAGRPLDDDCTLACVWS